PDLRKAPRPSPPAVGRGRTARPAPRLDRHAGIRTTRALPGAAGRSPACTARTLEVCRGALIRRRIARALAAGARVSAARGPGSGRNQPRPHRLPAGELESDARGAAADPAARERDRLARPDGIGT